MTLADLVLERPVDVEAVTFAGTVLVPERMDETIAVLTAIVEHGGEIRAPELGRHLFGRGRTAIAAQLLRSAASLDLVHPLNGDRWTTTAIGAEALATSHVLTPREGVWRARFTSDPLLGDAALDLQPVPTPRLYDSVRTPPEPDQLRRPPETLTSQLGLPFGGVLSTVAGQPVIADVAGNRADVELLPGAARLSWRPHDGELEIAVGALSGPVAAPPITMSEVGDAIAVALGRGRWNGREEHLEVRCDDIADGELQRGLVRGEQLRLDLPSYGTLVAERCHIPIAPWDDADAVLWQLRRLESSVDGYVTSPAWEALLEGSGLATSSPAPTRVDVATSIARRAGGGVKPDRYWYLQAPADWGL
jgi:hypothetical protein